jgi:hypothetical protein
MEVRRYWKPDTQESRRRLLVVDSVVDSNVSRCDQASMRAGAAMSIADLANCHAAGVDAAMAA